MNERVFRVPGASLTDLTDLVHLADLAVDDLRVVCPRCSRRAVVRGSAGPGRLLSCPSCSYAGFWPVDGARRVRETSGEPAFRRPPWLRGRRRAGGSWAFDRRTARDLRGPRRGRPPRR